MKKIVCLVWIISYFFSVTTILAFTEKSRKIIYLSTAEQIANASRGEDVYQALPSSVTFIIRNGVYKAPKDIKTLLWCAKVAQLVRRADLLAIGVRVLLFRVWLP